MVVNGFEGILLCHAYVDIEPSGIEADTEKLVVPFSQALVLDGCVFTTGRGLTIKVAGFEYVSQLPAVVLTRILYM